MQINQKFWQKIEPALAQLADMIGPDFVVFGSAPLYLLEVLDFDGTSDFNDLDIAVREGFVAPAGAREVLFHNDPRQKLHKMHLGGIDIDIGSAWPGREEIYTHIFVSYYEIRGFKFASLPVVKEWKKMMVREYGREKDQSHLAKIAEFARRKAESIVIREAREEETEDILRLKDEVWAATYSGEEYGISREEILGRSFEDKERSERMHKTLSGKRDEVNIWIAEDGDELVGICSAEKHKEMNHLGALYVHPNYQQMGIGQKLVEAAYGWLGRGNDIDLEVAVYNTKAIAFYERDGFVLSGPSDGCAYVKGKKIPLLRMIKKVKKD